MKSPANTSHDQVAFDYIIVGAGSAGCVIANRLSENPDVSVALIEAGGWDWNPWIHIPVGYFKTMHNPATDWLYETQADPGLNGRSLKWPRGKVIGGSSSINGLLYVRGQSQDYDHWRQLGNTGWGWDDVLPLFKKSETRLGGDDETRGRSGPLTVSEANLKWPICDAWLEAAQAAGYPLNPDYNGREQEGVNYFQLTTRNGWRCSSAKAYLQPVKNRKNLTIFTNAHTEQVLFEDSRATGVRIQKSGGAQNIFARRETIVSAGAIGSPQILMLSGIGDASHLKQTGIEPVHHSPDVGKNLQDHLQIRLVYRCKDPTLNDMVRTLAGRLKIAMEYAMTRSGPMSMAASLVAGFMKTRPELATPDIQFHVQPWSANSPGEGVHNFSGFTASVCQLRPESRGEIRLRTNNPLDHPDIHSNYLATQVDCDTAVAATKVARQIAGKEPLASSIASEYAPGIEVTGDAGLLEWARNSATTIYHPTSTCRMGQDDRAVVDEKLKVRGIEALRVADASIMPQIVSGNTNAPAIMIGEKAAQLILQET